MKRFALLFFFFGLTHLSFSQRVYFLYIQSENEQTFYLKMNERIYSSASKGYLILSHLRDSSYNFSLGFPGKNITEQFFSVKMNAKDHGFLLKDFNEKGWGLYDLQTMIIQMARSDNKGSAEIKKGPVKRDESAFTLILAKASDDSTLLEKPDLAQIKEEKKAEIKEVEKQPEQRTEEKKIEAKIEERKPDIVENKPAKIDSTKSSVAIKEESLQKIEEKKPDIVENKPVKIDSTSSPVSIKEESQPKIEEKKPDIVENKPAKIDSTNSSVAIKKESQQKIVEVKQSDQSDIYKRSEVVRESESFTTEGFGVTFIDESGDGKKDTIKIMIPQSKETIQTETKLVKEERKFLDITDSTKQIQSEPLKEAKDNPTETPFKTVANNCSSVADENDFFKLRKKMAGIPEDDNMIKEAAKTFKTKCFTTEQLKNLSTLFLSDGGKYKFFDAAYEHVSDIENFSSLQSELKGEYYINRFKAMLR